MKKNISLMLVFLTLIMVFSACGKNNTPTIGKIQLEDDVTTLLKEELAFDFLTEFEANPVNITEEDLTLLKEKYTSKIPYQKYDLSFVINSIDLNIKATFSCVYVYFQDEWKLSFMNRTNEGDWVYESKELVGTKKILKDLQLQKFDGFKEGFIGGEKNTRIKVIDRNTNESKTRDELNVEVKVTTEFAKYTFNMKVIYVFNKGIWNLESMKYDEVSLWIFEYIDDVKPTEPNINAITDKLTNGDNFLTYVANPEYSDNFHLTFINQFASEQSISYNYLFMVHYLNIGNIEYNISCPYIWSGGMWVIENMSVEFKGYDLKEMIKTWKLNDDNYFEFTSYSNGLLKGYFIKDGQKTEVDAKLEVILRDNNWSLNVYKSGDTNIFESAIINLAEKSIVIGESQYLPMEIEEPIAEENTEDPATENQE